MYAKVIIHANEQSKELNFQFDSDTLTDKLLDLAYKYNYFATGLAVIIGDGYNGRYELFDENRTAVFESKTSRLVKVDSMSITISETEF